MKTKFLIVAPTTREFDTVFNFLNNKSKAKKIDFDNLINVYSFEFQNQTTYLLKGEVGKVHVAANLAIFLSEIKVDLVLNVGVAGALNPSLKPFDVVVANKTCYYDVDLSDFYPYGQMDEEPLYFNCRPFMYRIMFPFKLHTGLIMTGDSFITNKNFKQEYFKLFDNPLACEMEGAAVCQVCRKFNTEVMVIRSISDCIFTKDDSQKEYEFNIIKACENVIQVLSVCLGI